MKYWYDKEFDAIVCEPNSADEWLWQLWAVGLDYDGCNSVKSLQELVDELVDMRSTRPSWHFALPFARRRARFSPNQTQATRKCVRCRKVFCRSK